MLTTLPEPCFRNCAMQPRMQRNVPRRSTADHSIPIGDSQFLERLDEVHACVVHQHVNAAEIVPSRREPSRPRPVLVGHVATKKNGVSAAAATDGFCHFLAFRLAPATHTTRAPSSANTSAIPTPMPLLAPVRLPLCLSIASEFPPQLRAVASGIRKAFYGMTGYFERASKLATLFAHSRGAASSYQVPRRGLFSLPLTETVCDPL